jgi:phospholipase/carboxylesterase
MEAGRATHAWPDPASSSPSAIAGSATKLVALDAVEIGPSRADAVVLWLHGLGADGHDFEPIVPELGLPQVRFVFPHAPVRPVTLNGGLPMRAWFDVSTLDWDQAEDGPGIRRSEALVREHVERELDRGVALERIVLAGFSQGGAIALHTGLRYPGPLAGIIGLSTYLPLAEQLVGEAHEANRQTPIMMAHGHADQVIPLPFAERSRDLLHQWGYRLQWFSYPMAHGVCAEEVRDIRAWLLERLG